jgi:glycosyltransferase involved in cell wall biosynthesis
MQAMLDELDRMPKYSIVVPFHNEEENVTVLYARLKQVMEQVGDSFELVLVDDGSSDRTYKLLEEIAAVDSRVLVVKLRRNFGQTSALAAGFDHASGEFILAMDGDLQHDPNEIPSFLEKLEEGYDVVSGWRKERIDNFVMRRIPSRCANWLMAKLSGVLTFTTSAPPSRPIAARSSRTSRSTARCTASFPRWPAGTARPSARFPSAT